MGVACGSTRSGSEDSASALHLALIPKAGNNLVFDIGNDGAQYAASDISRGGEISVDVEYMAPTELDPERQRQLVREAVDAGKDGLIISCTDASLTETINEAVEAGVPVMTYDSDCPDSDRMGFYSMDSEATGIKAADLLVEAMGTGRKTVAILNGRSGADNLERRQAAFLGRVTDAYPDVEVTTVVNCEETAEDCSAAVEELLDEEADLDGLFVVGLWGLLEACSCSDTALTCLCEDNQMPNWKGAAAAGLKTVAYDTLPFEVELLKQGYISALIGQKYFGWGHDSVHLMHDHLTGGAPLDGFIDSGFDVVCVNHADEFLEKWLSADFTEPLDEDCDL